LSRRPRVYFEEWDDPLISGIKWVSELIEIAGGDDCFPELGRQPLAKNRTITSTDEVVRRMPDLIVASWCGKRFDADKVVSRSNWDKIPAVRAGQVYELDPSIILQPGPAALTDGVSALQKLFQDWDGSPTTSNSCTKRTVRRIGERGTSVP
jgi:iron complex transport system substrate-binding protein